jgi:hypothetical protein
MPLLPRRNQDLLWSESDQEKLIRFLDSETGTRVLDTLVTVVDCPSHLGAERAVGYHAGAKTVVEVLLDLASPTLMERRRQLATQKGVVEQALEELDRPATNA